MAGPKTPTTPLTTPPTTLSRAPFLTPDQRHDLAHLSDLLHLLHHRNRNQHRRAVWYRHFATFRKQLLRLIVDLEALHFEPSTHTERVKKKRENEILLVKIEQRLGYWMEAGLVGKWWRAFSQVVAEGRFAQVGLVLLGLLGQVCGILGITGRLEEEGDVEVRAAIERFGREEGGVDVMGTKMEESRGAGAEEREAEDIGVAISRAEENESREGGVSTVGETDWEPRAKEKKATTASKRPASPPPKTKPSKRKRKKGDDAIDDLFRGLG